MGVSTRTGRANRWMLRHTSTPHHRHSTTRHRQFYDPNSTFSPPPIVPTNPLILGVLPFEGAPGRVASATHPSRLVSGVLHTIGFVRPTLPCLSHPRDETGHRLYVSQPRGIRLRLDQRERHRVNRFLRFEDRALAFLGWFVGFPSRIRVLSSFHTLLSLEWFGRRPSPWGMDGSEPTLTDTTTVDTDGRRPCPWPGRIEFPPLLELVTDE